MKPVFWIVLGVGVVASFSALAKGKNKYPKQLSFEGRKSLIESIANAYGFHPAVARAIFTVESGEKGFSNGRLIIRFEPAKFFKFTGKQVPDLLYSSETVTDQDRQWLKFEKAYAINANAALESISMGGPQIMGFNYKSAGYKSAGEMFVAFSESEVHQIRSFFRFLSKYKDGKILAAIFDNDFDAVAKLYNGQTEPYAGKMLKEYNRLFAEYEAERERKEKEKALKEK